MIRIETIEIHKNIFDQDKIGELKIDIETLNAILSDKLQFEGITANDKFILTTVIRVHECDIKKQFLADIETLRNQLKLSVDNGINRIKYALENDINYGFDMALQKNEQKRN